MVQYEYDIEEEGFRRVDRRGKILPINIMEARRIASLLDLGWGADAIHNKMVYTQSGVTRTTTKSFIKNYRNGNINLDGDYPAPVKVMEAMDTEVRLNDLDNRVANLENIISELKSDCFAGGFATCGCSEERNWKNLWGRL